MAQTRSSSRRKAQSRTLSADRSGGGVTALAKLPPPPAALTQPAREAWQSFGKSAIRLGTMSEYDTGLLELLARTWASCVELEVLLARDGLVLESGSGAKKAHPALAALDRARALAHKMIADLGLTPPARERVSIDPAGRRAEDPADKHLA